MCELFIKADSDLWESTTRSLRIDRMVTSVRLETYFWTILEEIARRDDMSVGQLLTRLHNESIEAGHDLSNFTSFLRVCCLRYLSLQVTDDIPKDKSVPISTLNAPQLLKNERAYRAQTRASATVS
ncbi:Predicted DNA-binding protein, contains Ribbon-helix-helix (RHH) domain [Pseudovibrio denitrificans]|uniref:Predicted DNA-binding protein, contains Ribbon-helix-helix (RHH) domain n=1 Tax=Pseudovibrio denitrificans TaxID=258256 RepID=A0A1I6ZJ61_9HYPH|nr:ribbon-helix-helix domain-containing protein [Pseudovibrio denitrificans]SFT62716.1 Predicted DNA-binding protein, contains Ribbon-helix-helix (RHH) domain [Pseudovibrio denitrificans]